MPSTCGASLMAFNLSAAANRCQGESPYWPPDQATSDGLSVKVFGSVRRADRGSSRPTRGLSRHRTTVRSMRVAMMTREYPPEVYGGAGVHVTELVAQLRRLCDVDVHCMGAPRAGVIVAQPDPALKGANPALSTLSADLTMVNGASNATVVHSHTWYTGLAGHLTALLYGIPHVLTAHSLEPMRPWKAEQLGGGYRVSSWVEKTAAEAADAVIAVSSGMRDDVLKTYPALDPSRVHVVRNGLDTDVWYPVQPDADESVLKELGVDLSRPI